VTNGTTHTDNGLDGKVATVPDTGEDTMSDAGSCADESLPHSGRLDIGVLARLFDEKVTSYKYFFFLALLDRIEKGLVDRPLPLSELAVDMVLAAWYPHGFCRLSFGSQDRLQHTVDHIAWGEVRGSWIVAGGEDWERLRARCAASQDPRALTKFVPYRLLRPFFATELRSARDQDVNERIVELAERLFTERKPFYCFSADRTALILQHDWIEYLGRNAAIIRGWARFKLAGYLQARNPVAGGIIEKLEPPIMRSPLTKQVAWWREALPLIGDKARCIYTGIALDTADLSLDHYLPWSFVAHDRSWNLVPVSRSVNSSKSDHIPDHRYIAGLTAIQHAAISTLKSRWPEERWTVAVEPWIVDLGIGKTSILDLPKLRAAYETAIGPLETIAERQGFPKGWVYGSAGTTG